MKNGLRHGKGLYESVDGVKYDGEWQNGLKHGQGRIVMRDGMIYEGSWTEGIIQGYGEIRWPSGNVYKGEFRNNRINGNGYLIWYDSSEKYIGQWTDTLQNGLGIHIWYELKGEQKYLRNRYVGEWRGGFRHGYGVFFYSNGSKYEGTWDQNYKHGYGVFTFHDGSQYIGRFHNDRMIDFNSNGLYVPGNIGKIEGKDRNVSTANSRAGGAGGRSRGVNASTTSMKAIPEVENDMTTTGNFKPNSTNTSIMPNERAERNRGGNTNLNRIDEIPENNDSIISGTNRGGVTTNLISGGLGGSNTTNTANFNNLNASTMNMTATPNDPPLNRTNNPVISNRAMNSKDAELNQFKTTLDIADIIECEPDIENSLKEIENILLRHLTEMKLWYKYYTNKDKEGFNKDEINFTSINASVYNNAETSKTGNTFLPTIKEDGELNRKPSITNVNAINTSVLEGIYNNDLGFCMQLKDMWKFLRESNVLSSEFSLAQFNRIFFKGPKNYIEMFMCPEDLDQKHYYDYIYLMITKAKDDFMAKYKSYFEKNKRGGETGELINESLFGKDSREIKEKDSLSNLNYQTSELEITFDIHNKHQVILLRQFYEAVVRVAYLRYFHMNQALHVKLNYLIDNCIKQNQNFKKAGNVRKSYTHTMTDISVNMSVLDMKVKNIETSLDTFLSNYEKQLCRLFKILYYKSTANIKKYDMTITYRYFYDNIILKSNTISEFLGDKLKYIEIINIYHKDKIKITEENKLSMGTFAYVENLLECEFIFFEFCEMIFYICKKYFLFKGIKENYPEIVKHIQEVVEKIPHISENLQKMKYYYPKLDHHRTFEKIIEDKRQKEEEERRRLFEQKRVELERKLMNVEDQNVMPETVNEEEERSEMSDDSY